MQLRINKNDLLRIISQYLKGEGYDIPTNIEPHYATKKVQAPYPTDPGDEVEERRFDGVIVDF